MKIGSGLPVFPGVAIGPAVIYRKVQVAAPVSCGTPEEEQQKFNQAVETAKQQLDTLYRKAVVELGQEHAAIVEVQLLMLEDLDFIEGVADEIANGASAAEAASGVGEMMAQMMASMNTTTSNKEYVTELDKDRFYNGVLNGPTASGAKPVFKVTFSAPKSKE